VAARAVSVSDHSLHHHRVCALVTAERFGGCAWHPYLFSVEGLTTHVASCSLPNLGRMKGLKRRKTRHCSSPQLRSCAFAKAQRESHTLNAITVVKADKISLPNTAGYFADSKS
jgi:hypothetical protein